jgi:SAM-dependent methyltransferase
MPIESSNTVLVDNYRNAALDKLPAHGGYKGLRIHALPGLHPFTAALASSHLQAGDHILDLAAGSGAMSLRLHDLGMRVTATDYVEENFRLHGQIPFVRADLNEPFAATYACQFDAVMASEIIEHLENPRHFARECFRLLKPGGKVILSTPNVDSAASIVRFLRDGTFAWFSETDYVKQGHITPLTQWQIEKSFSEAGFATRWKGSFGDEAGTLDGSPRLVLLSKALGLLSGLGSGLRKQIFVAVFAKPAEMSS